LIHDLLWHGHCGFDVDPESLYFRAMGIFVSVSTARKKGE